MKLLILEERPRNAITSLTGIDVPKLAIFKGVNEVAITAATKQIFNINSKVLRNLADKYVPLEGIDMISKGLTVMHYSPNGNEDIKDKDQKVSFKVRCKKHLCFCVCACMCVCVCFSALLRNL